MAVNSEPKILLANSLFLQEKYADAFEQYSKIFEEDPTNLLALLKRATCQANLGNWEAALTDAITAREMDPRSVEAWKLCARGLAGGDVNAALDCLLEALHIDCNDQEACTILQSIVEDHLNKTIEGVHRKDLGCVSWETQESQIQTLEQIANGTDSIEQKLLCHIQFWSSLNKLVENRKLTFDQIDKTKSNSINILNTIGNYYNEQHEYQWALACHFLALYNYKLRHSSTNVSNVSTFNDNQIVMISNIASDWFQFNKTSKAVEFFDSNVNLESVKSSKFLCTLLINISPWLIDLDIRNRPRLILEKAIKIAEEQDYKYELSSAYLILGHLYLSLGNIDCALSYLYKSENIACLIGNKNLISSSLNYIGQCLLLQCQFKEALEKIQEASNFDPEPKTQLAIYITLGRIYLVLSIENLETDESYNFKMAKEHFERGLKLGKELRNIGQTFVCLTLLGQLHLLHKIFDESIKYLNAAVSSAATVGGNRFLCQIYAEHFLFKFFSRRGQDRCDLEQAEKWLDKTEDCFSKMWDELKQDIDKITWSDQQNFVRLNHMIQLTKWLADKKLEALFVAERFRARSFRDSMQMRQSTRTEQVLICQADDIKAVAYKLGHPIVFFSCTNNPDYFFCWIINPLINDIVSQKIYVPAKTEDAEHTFNNNDIPLPEKDDQNVRALCEIAENSLRKLYSYTSKTKTYSPKYENYPLLFKHLWKCLEPHLNINKELPNNKVIIIPDDELWHVSFPLLTDENGKRLLHKYAISLALSISSLKASKTFTELREKLNSALVIGNPEVSDKDELCAKLPMATVESHNVKDLLEAKLHDVKLEYFTGPTATKMTVLSAISKVQLFHIASHATISTSSATQLPGSLLLARDPTTDESGILTADEIQSLDLRGLRLAFLNCCYTGAGRVFAEGLVGLARAFLYAGAHEVVVSMRPASDSKTTCDFVKKFYEEYLEKGKGEADIALNKAQKHMEENGVDIREWGSFYVLRQKLCD